MLPQRPWFVKPKEVIQRLPFSGYSGYPADTMTKPAAVAMILFVVCILVFATWQMFLGRFEAAFSALPFLVICYLFVRPWRRTENDPPE